MYLKLRFKRLVGLPSSIHPYAVVEKEQNFLMMDRGRTRSILSPTVDSVLGRQVHVG